MNVMNSPLADLRARDDHVRLLLDQRAARADLHGRFPSLSEFSDSPSVYSHPHFSPRPSDRVPLDGTPQPFRFPQSPRLYSPSLSEPRSPISDRERLNIPTASSLDLEDDPRSSADYSSMHNGDDSSPEEDGEEEVPRISMYGPKMRFHSPAPWEEDETDISRDSLDEPSKRSKKKGDAGKKGWSLSRSTGESRPSNDSARSSRPKQSFETSSTLSATGALAALAQASMSSTSLAINQSPQTLRDKLSLPRLRSRTPSNVGQMDALPTPNNASPVSRLTSPSDVDADDRSLGHSSTRSATPQYAEYTHPYANPDLVRVANLDPPPLSPNFQSTFGTNRGDSNATLTDTTPSSSMSQFRSTTTISITPGTSTTSVNPSMSESMSSSKVGGKGISGPMPVDKSSLPLAALNMLNTIPQSPVVQPTPMSPGPRTRENTLQGAAMAGLPAWHESNSGGALKLISLEEAQAQARERSRSATAHPVISSPYATTSKMPIPDPDSDGSQRGQGRTRSSSAGASKNKQQPPASSDSPGQSNGPHRQVVRKKSGFMRLFNGKDRDRVSPSSPPPPVPMFSSDAFAANPLPPLPPPQYSRPRQGSAPHRVPVPSLSPSLMGDSGTSSGPASGGSGSGSASSSECSPSATALPASAGHNLRDQQLSARRKVPDLSIVTSSPSLGSMTAKVPYTAPLSAGANEVSHFLTPTTAVAHSDSSNGGTLPCSAPPSKTDFVGLSIRPVSTLFSRELKEQLAVDDTSLRARPSLEVDTGTPTTATTVISPLSPDFPSSTKYGRSSDEKSGPVIAQDDRDQSSVIQALQEQILTARRAWQRQIWELEGQVRDLKAEVEELRAAEGNSEYCAACGRGSVRKPSAEENRNLEELKRAGVKTGVVNRPRARTGVGSRFASGT
ncbi:hypothetical protein C8Q77DRAFT_1045433 [Trametes polyzona]|nr:hypothetical protein C8Q77DRAFT_1045433 [Trametes polyzona]